MDSRAGPLPEGLDGLLESLAEHMAQRWRQGERPLAEEYLHRHAHLWDQPEAALQLVYEEMHLRQEHGEEVCAEDLLGRFPHWRRQVQALLECHQLLAARLSGPAFPAVGETVGEFRLLAELGRGTHSQVFLAAQPSLADRPVVLKLGPHTGREQMSLARLQHTHIVPLYSVHELPGRQLCALCLPYFGGTTLDQLLEALRGRPPGQRRGQHLLEVLRQAPAGPAAAGGEGPSCRFLGRVSYVQAVCWIGACLADALHYAHEQGLLHLDLKPSNVLLTAAGQPMLLDFHLARAPLAARSSAPLWLGGTPGYMAPEQQAALTAVARRQPLTQALDVGADIYGLGVLLYELAGGRLPAPGEAPARALRCLNPSVSPALADLVARCLRPAAADRYPTAADLACDLRRHLADLPLRGVANRSLVERWGKWRRRRRHALPLLGLLAVVVLTLAGGLGHVYRQADRAQTACKEGQAHLEQGGYTEAADAYRHGLALAEDVPFRADLGRQLHDGLRQAERGQAARELHQLSQRLKPLYSATTLPQEQVHTAEAQCRALWQQRRLILQRLGSGPGQQVDNQVRADLLDLAILGTYLHVRLAAGHERTMARQQALEVLDEAEALFGPSCVLARERQAHAQALGLTEVAVAAANQAATLAPRTAWEHCALGLVHFRAGDYRRALEEMDQALEQEPNSLWPSFYRGCCVYHLGQLEEACVAFSVCVALAPQCAWCYTNRGLAYGERGQLERALRDYDRALQLDPTLAAAHLGRSVLHSRQNRHAEALADLDQAEGLGMNTAVLSYQRALIHLARHERADALRSLHEALRRDPQHEAAKALLEQLQHQG